MISLKSISSDGREWSHTAVRIPQFLHDMAIERKEPMSLKLNTDLEKKLEKGTARGQNATNTEAPAPLSSTDKQVDE